jgi:hypothetical protein
MPRRFRSVTALLVVFLAAAAAPVASAIAAGDGPAAHASAPRQRPGGKPDPRCRSIENRVSFAQRQVDLAQSALRTAKQKVAAKRAALRRASGRRAKARASKALKAAQKAQRTAQRHLDDAKSRLAGEQHDAKQFNCTTS